MIRFAGRGILVDLEGTLASRRFVQEELLGFARQRLFTFLRLQWNNPEVRAVRDLLAREAGAESFLTFVGGPNVPPEYMFRKLREHATHLMNQDTASLGLKQLQGLIWRHGFQEGALHGHVYDDVPLALEAWSTAGRAVRLYCTVSVPAQQAYFKHTKCGDLAKHLSGYYDLTTGAPHASASYRTIAADWQQPPDELLRLSAHVDHLDAAREAGYQTALVVRPENAPSEPTHQHPVVRTLTEIELA